MNYAKELCADTVELSTEVVALCEEINALVISAGGEQMFEPEGTFDVEEVTEGMSASDMLQFNLDSAILLEELKGQLTKMILKLRGVK